MSLSIITAFLHVFCRHGELQSSAVPGDWAQGLGARKWLNESCKVNVSSPCCLYHCLRSTPLFRYGTFLSVDLASSPCGLCTCAPSWGLKPAQLALKRIKQRSDFLFSSQSLLLPLDQWLEKKRKKAKSHAPPAAIGLACP